LLDVTLPPSVFNAAFNKLKGDKKFVGIRLRGFYVANSGATPEARTFKHFAPNFITNMRKMVRAGLRAFDIPEEDTHPTATVALAREFPNVNFIVNHYANYGGHKSNTFTVDQAWLDDLALLASERNILVKVGFILKWGNPTPGNFPWPIKVSDNLSAYRPGLDALLNAFGPDRLLWESNWPTSEMSGGLRTAATPGDGKAGWREGAVDTIDLSLRIVESWLASKQPSVRDKIMGENALRIYSPRR
jgi:predicted TIM-barrel fold metal-dependent hydrolase